MFWYDFCFPTDMNEKPACPKCKSTNVIKNGKVQEKQRLKCKSRSYQYVRLTPRGRPPKEKAMAITLYTLGLSMRAIANIFHLSPNAILKWIKAFAKENYKKPVPGDAILNVALFQVKKNKLWIWKAN